MLAQVPFFSKTDLPGFREISNNRIYLPIGKLGGRGITFSEGKETKKHF